MEEYYARMCYINNRIKVVNGVYLESTCNYILIYYKSHYNTFQMLQELFKWLHKCGHFAIV